jgi:hypothetical protein
MDRHVDRVHTQFLWINPLRKRHLEELEHDGKTMLGKWVEKIGD